MPTIPRLTRTVGAAALPTVRRTAASTAEAEGAGVELARGRLEATQEVGKATRARGVAGVGEQVAGLGIALYAQVKADQRQAANETALLEASNQLSDWTTKRLYDPQSGAYAVKGKEAMPLPETIRAEFDHVTSEISATLVTPEQKAAFQKLQVQEWQQLDLGVRRHVFGEMQSYQAAELKHHVENAADAAIRAAGDPRQIQVELSKATNAIAASARMMGTGPEQVAAQQAAVTSQVHVGVISQLLATNQEQQAAAYFEATKSGIDADKVDDVTKALEEGSYRGQSQKKSDEIIRAGGSLTEQRAKAREITDSKLRDMVMERIEHNAVVVDREARERDEAAMKGGYNTIDQTGDVTAIPPDVWQSYSGVTRSAMLSYARTRAAGVDVATNWGAYYTLMNMAAEDPTGFAQANLMGSRHLLGDTEFKQIASLQASIKAGDRTTSEKDLAPFRTKTQLIDDSLIQHGIDPTAKPDTPEAKAIAQLRRMLDRRVEVLQAGGKRATNEDIQAEIDSLLSQSVKIPGSFWFGIPGTRSFSGYEKRVLDLTVSDIPTAIRTQIEQALRVRNRPVSDATVLDLYVEMQLRERRK